MWLVSTMVYSENIESSIRYSCSRMEAVNKLLKCQAVNILGLQTTQSLP